MTKTPNSYGSNFARCLIDWLQFELSALRFGFEPAGWLASAHRGAIPPFINRDVAPADLPGLCLARMKVRGAPVRRGSLQPPAMICRNLVHLAFPKRQ